MSWEKYCTVHYRKNNIQYAAVRSLERDAIKQNIWQVVNAEEVQTVENIPGIKIWDRFSHFIWGRPQEAHTENGPQIPRLPSSRWWSQEQVRPRRIRAGKFPLPGPLRSSWDPQLCSERHAPALTSAPWCPLRNPMSSVHILSHTCQKGTLRSGFRPGQKTGRLNVQRDRWHPWALFPSLLNVQR